MTTATEPAKESALFSIQRDGLKREENRLKNKVEAARKALQDAQGELTEHGRVMRDFYAKQD